MDGISSEFSVTVVSQYSIDIIKDMYEGIPTSVCSVDEISNEFLAVVVLHQGSVLSSFLFTLIIIERTSR